MPFIKSISNLEKYQVGGSLSITFTDYFGKQYCLLFPRIPDPLAANFETPSLEIFVRIKRKSATTGIVQYEWEGKPGKLDWTGAQNLLRKLKKHLKKVESDRLAVYDEMVEVARVKMRDQKR